MSDTLRIDYDHDALDIMDNVNELLKPLGLAFVDDGQPHDGYAIFTLQRTEPER